MSTWQASQPRDVEASTNPMMLTIPLAMSRPVPSSSGWGCDGGLGPDPSSQAVPFGGAAPEAEPELLTDDERRGSDRFRSSAAGRGPAVTAGERAVAGRGGQVDADRLIEASLGLVVTIARRYRNLGLEMDDLIGEGNLGLARAARAFDPSFGTRFGTFATYWIKQAIRDALTDSASTIRVPAWMVKLLVKWRAAERGLRDRTGHDPTSAQVASYLGMTVKQKDLVEQALRALRLRAGAACEDEGEILWLAEAEASDRSPYETLETEDRRRVLANQLKNLNERECSIVAMHFGLDGETAQSYAEIARGLGISREGVRRVGKRAIQNLKRFLTREVPSTVS